MPAAKRGGSHKQTRPGGRPMLHFVVGHLEAGFRIVPQQVVLVSAAELFQRQDLARTTRRRQARAIDSFSGAARRRPGRARCARDWPVSWASIVGKGRPGGRTSRAGVQRRHKDLCAECQDRAGAEIRRRQGRKVLLANIGGKAWVRQKEAAQKAVTDLAAEMIELQAARDARPGIAFPSRHRVAARV